MKIEKLSGTDPRLYKLVAPLVMSPAILRQNNNYPFKTSTRHTWFVATESSVVLGFIPVEIKTQSATIDNYYISGDEPELLGGLIDRVIKSFGEKYPVYSVTHARHTSVFEEKGFALVKEWKLYVKMEWKGYDKDGEKCI